MGRPLEMRGWAVKHTALDGKSKILLDYLLNTRALAREYAYWENKWGRAVGHRYTVVPVVVRERR